MTKRWFPRVLIAVGIGLILVSGGIVVCHSVDDYLAGVWGISLFTCNTDGKLRVLVRCSKEA